MAGAVKAASSLSAPGNTPVEAAWPLSRMMPCNSSTTPGKATKSPCAFDTPRPRPFHVACGPPLRRDEDHPVRFVADERVQGHCAAPQVGQVGHEPLGFAHLGESGAPLRCATKCLCQSTEELLKCLRGDAEVVFERVQPRVFLRR